MSNDAAEPTGPAKPAGAEPTELAEERVEPFGRNVLPRSYGRLEAAVRRLLDEAAGYRARAEMAERRAAELEDTLRELSSGGLDPLKLQSGLEELEEENQALRRRMENARDRVRQLIARFDFLREEL